MFPPQAPTATFPYQILEKIGEGGMGEVYQADDIELGRKVAIKIIKPSFIASLSEPEARSILQRFLQEARAAAAVSHTGATTVHAIGTEAGWPYIAMEWLEGRNLEAILKKRHRLTVPQVARIGTQVLDFLIAAHAAGIIHRDIKPANLMVTPSGQVKVTDFGVARVQGSAVAHTQVGLVMGTPQYAAPEQLAGMTVDARADLYALGCVLYECLVGHPPFTATSLPELVHQVKTLIPPAPSSLIPGLASSFDAILALALAKDPSARFADARTMLLSIKPLGLPEATSAPAQAPVTGTVVGPMAAAFSRPASVSPPVALAAASVPLVSMAPVAPMQPAAPMHAVSSPAVPVTAALASTASVLATAQTLHRAPTLVVEGTSAMVLVANAVRQWSPVPLGRAQARPLLERLLERPLHAPAFSGALESSGTFLLFHDGIIYGAFDPGDGRVGDAVIDALPEMLDATLYKVPEGVDGRVSVILASLLGEPDVLHADIDASFASLPHLAQKLCNEGFDGVIRFTQGSKLGFSLFSRGQRVLDLFSREWPQAQAATRWETWIPESGARASVERLKIDYPSITFRKQLEGVVLDVLRAAPTDTGSIRTDTLATARALQLVPGKALPLQLRRGESTLHFLLEGDPARAAARWMLVELEAELRQFDRVSAWKALAEPLGQVRTVHLHDRLPGSGPGGVRFDAFTLGEHGEVQHVIDRLASVDARAIDRFVARVLEAKASHPELGGALLLAPSFTEEALEAYLKALSASKKSSVLEAFSHKEGYFRTRKGGVHILLVEEAGDRRRPLVPE